LDTLLFVAIFVASRPIWTGISVHMWLGGLVAVPALYHLAINWDWVTRIASRLLARLRATSRLNFAVDAVLFMAFVTVVLSGFMVLPGVIPAENAVVFAVWLHAHQVSSDITIVSMLIHFVLHARWMSDAVANRGYLPPVGRHSAARPGVLVRLGVRR
jgi:hypothetical protein